MKTLKGMLFGFLSVVLFVGSMGSLNAQEDPKKENFVTELGPNEIPPVFFKFSSDPLLVKSKGTAELQFWPEECESCSVAAVITDGTKVFDTEGNELKLSILKRYTIFKAQALVFESDSNSVLSSIVLVTEE